MCHQSRQAALGRHSAAQSSVSKTNDPRVAQSCPRMCGDPHWLLFQPLLLSVARSHLVEGRSCERPFSWAGKAGQWRRRQRRHLQVSCIAHQAPDRPVGPHLSVAGAAGGRPSTEPMMGPGAKWGEALGDREQWRLQRAPQKPRQLVAPRAGTPASSQERDGRSEHTV